MSEELKACPFCGRVPSIVYQLVSLDDYSIICECGISGPGNHTTVKQAIKFWNTRAKEPKDAG